MPLPFTFMSKEGWVFSAVLYDRQKIRCIITGLASSCPGNLQEGPYPPNIRVYSFVWSPRGGAACTFCRPMPTLMLCSIRRTLNSSAITASASTINGNIIASITHDKSYCTASAHAVYIPPDPDPPPPPCRLHGKSETCFLTECRNSSVSCVHFLFL